MSNQQILTKAIEKAIAGGWKSFDSFRKTERFSVDNTLSVTIEDNTAIGHYDYQTIIFNHDFAKALWGKEERHYPTQAELNESYRGAIAGELYNVTNKGWQYHLQQMVIADDPIKYLGEHLNA